MHYGSVLNKIHKYVHVHVSGGVTVEKVMLIKEAVESLMVCEDISPSPYQLTVNIISLYFLSVLHIYGHQFCIFVLSKKNVQNMPVMKELQGLSFAVL